MKMAERRTEQPLPSHGVHLERTHGGLTCGGAQHPTQGRACCLIRSWCLIWARVARQIEEMEAEMRALRQEAASAAAAARKEAAAAREARCLFPSCANL